jgi:ribosomal protein S18 acetylase RimI-like enzyme
MASSGWTIRAFDPSDLAGVAKLLMQVATFDGGTAALPSTLLSARLQHPSAHAGAGWRVAVSHGGTIIGALLVSTVGTLRTEIEVAVNPAFRRQGIGRALIDVAPREKRLLATSRASVAGAAALLTRVGFRERHSQLVMRREVGKAPSLSVEGTAFNEDPRRDARRAIAALTALHGEDIDGDRPWMKARLARERVGVVYLQAPGDADTLLDAGLCIVEPSDRARKGERTASGEPIVGVLTEVGLLRTMRGKGMSRALVREGIRLTERLGFRFVQVSVDKRSASAVELYEREGFEVIDEDVYWWRREKRGSKF